MRYVCRKTSTARMATDTTGGASMRKTAVLVWALVLAAFVSVGSAQQRLVQGKLQLKWFHQAQFPGYFVAKEQGFFRDEGLEVTLLPIGAQSPMQTVVSGGADFGTTWITDLLTAREQGLPVVHLAQMFQRSGYTMVSLKSTGLKSVCDLKGKKVGVWPAGNEYPAAALFRKCGVTSTLDPKAPNPDVDRKSVV